MKYTISNLHSKTSDLDDDVVEFVYDIYFTEPDEMFVSNYHLFYRELMYHLKEAHPDFHKYLEDVRRSVDGWGPCERRTMEALGEEGLVQLYKYAEEYLYNGFNMQAIFDQHKKWTSGTVQEQVQRQQEAEKVFNDLSQLVPAARESTNRYRQFCEDATKALRTITLDIFPEVADMDAEKLKEFKYIYVNEILSMTDTLEKFLLDKK
jgi:hypothetical protein